MGTGQPSAEPEREVRFGLVLYGGVSLAVYIYGVAYEFQRLVRASAGVEENAWTGVLEAAGASATVDIVSGASAGGINGVLLGKALTEGADLRAVRSLWLDQADLESLLRDPGERDPKSLLRSQRFRELLDKGLADLDRQSLRRPLVSAFDLFVSGTRLRPWVRDFRTDLDGLIQTGDYRKSFHLKYRTRARGPEQPWRGYHRDDFAARHNRMLAEVAQATSAFPVAFEPVEIAVGPHNQNLFAEDEPRRDFFSDGGILHNKPFTEMISTIFTRAADRPVDRWLVSVEPDPEHMIQTGPEEPAPEVTEVFSKAVVGIPRYQSIAGDLDRLEQHREGVRRAREMLAGIDRALLAELAERLGREDGDETAVRAWRDEILAASGYRSERRRSVAAALSARIAAGWPEEAVPQAVAELEEALLALAEESLLEGADAGFEQRRIYHLLELSRQLLRGQEPDGWAREAIAAAQRDLWTQFERVDWALWSVFESSELGIGPETLGSDQLALALQRPIERLRSRLDLVGANLHKACQQLDSIWADVYGRRPAPLPLPPFTPLLGWFELWDVQLLPLTEVGDLAARDTVRLARISPGDAQYIQRTPEEKLAGDTLAHFSGFLKREWRHNDVLWGRLDAAETIVRMLLHRVGDEQSVQTQIRAAQEEIFRDELPDVQGEYRNHMENEYAVGSETLAAIPVEKRASLVLGSAAVLRNMLRGLGDSSRVPGSLRKLFGWIGRAVSLALFVFRWPVLAVWGRDHGLRRGLDLAIFFVGLWSVSTLVLIALGVIGPTSTLWTLIASGLGVFLAWCLLHGLRVPRVRRALRRLRRLKIRGRA